jgi:sulfhydrogenase subunit beta (sulfur reductase)
VNQQPLILPRDDLGRLLQLLKQRGYRLIGPTIQHGAIVYDRIESDADLPIGWTDLQEPGRYRLERRSDQAVFGYAVGPHSYKKLFHVPEERLWTVRRNKNGVELTRGEPEAPALALIGARGCDLSAIDIQDRVLQRGAHADPRYAARRRDVFVIAVNCGHAGRTCFCASMGTGPKARPPFELSLTEILDGDHRFLVELGSPRGADLASELGLEPAPAGDVSTAERIVAQTAGNMGRTLDTTGIRDLLVGNPEHPRWDDVASRCLACTNCTMVCPTCFCSTVEDTSDLEGETAERRRRWDSCFTLDFSYLHGGSVRSTTRARYRQWLTHKLATWYDQFGSSGCVGCGRCITWCPVGIDITEEVAAIRG